MAVEDLSGGGGLCLANILPFSKLVARYCRVFLVLLLHLWARDAEVVKTIEKNLVRIHSPEKLRVSCLPSPINE